MTRKQTCVACLLTAVALIAPVVASAQKLVIVVRHAERADGGAAAAPMSGAPADPALSAIGEARAAKLAVMLADAGIKSIYATEFKRTQDTGKPLAAKLGVAVLPMKSADTPALIAALKKDHPADIVLVIGHSNTVPGIIKALGGPDVTVADADYDSLFVVVPATGAVTRMRF